MTNEYALGHRVRHIRDGLVGTVAGLEQLREDITPIRTYHVKWDNGSFESRIDPTDLTDVPSA